MLRGTQRKYRYLLELRGEGQALKLFRSMVDYLSARIISQLVHEGVIEVDDRKLAVAKLAGTFTEDLMVEDRLNEEVREIMNRYADEMTRTGVQYHEMFKKIKGELVRQRRLIL